MAIPPTMTAAVFRGPDDLRIESVPTPTAGPAEVLLLGLSRRSPIRRLSHLQSALTSATCPPAIRDLTLSYTCPIAPRS